MSISISARIRPLLQEEVQNGEKTVWKVSECLTPDRLLQEDPVLRRT